MSTVNLNEATPQINRLTSVSFGEDSNGGGQQAAPDDEARQLSSKYSPAVRKAQSEAPKCADANRIACPTSVTTVDLLSSLGVPIDRQTAYLAELEGLIGRALDTYFDSLDVSDSR